MMDLERSGLGLGLIFVALMASQTNAFSIVPTCSFAGSHPATFSATSGTRQCQHETQTPFSVSSSSPRSFGWRAPIGVGSGRSGASQISLRSGPVPPPTPPPANAQSKAEQADLNFALWDAAKNGDTAQVESLIKQGANVNYYDPEMLQCTALQWACNNGHVDTAKKIISMGGSVMPTNQFGWTAMHHAANWGYIDVVRMLIDAGADPNVQSESNKTPAQCAAFKGFVNVVEVIKAASGVADGLITDNGTDNIEGYTQQVFRTTGRDYSEWLEEWDQPPKKAK